MPARSVGSVAGVPASDPGRRAGRYDTRDVAAPDGVPVLNEPFVLVASLIAVGAMLIVAFPVHEFSHAFAAFQLGDNTARWQGRLSLDPRRHFDPLGGGLLVLSAVLGGFFIGWAKPTPVNPTNLHGGRQGEAIVAAAGPISNLVMAAVVAVLLRGLDGIGLIAPSPLGGAPSSIAVLVYDVVTVFVEINVFLFMFNLIPIPPLDGYRVLVSLVNPRTAWQIRQYEQYGIMLILVIFLLGGRVIAPIGEAIFSFLAGHPPYLYIP